MRAKFSRLLILLLLFTALGLPVTVCVHAAEEVNIDELKEATNAAIESEGGSIFEKIIGKTLAAIATGIKSFSYKVLGFKSLDTLIFNKGTGGRMFCWKVNGTIPCACGTTGCGPSPSRWYSWQS